MKYLSPILALVFFSQANSARNVAEPLPAYYDVLTGNLTIDSTNVFEGESIGYGLQAWWTPLRYENHTPFMDTFFVTATSGYIGESNLENPIPGGVYSLGNILPIGLSEQELVEQFFGPNQWGEPAGPNWTGRKYSVTAGLGDGTIHVLQPVYSPSPFPALNDETASTPRIERWADEVSLEYNALTGDVTLDTTGENGGAIWSYRIGLNEPRFAVDEFKPIVSAFNSAVVEADRIVEAGFSGIPEGVHSLGNVLPAGLDKGELSLLIDKLRFIGEPGHSIDSLNVEVSGLEMSLVHSVPEPRIGALLFLAAAMLFRRCLTKKRLSE